VLVSRLINPRIAKPARIKREKLTASSVLDKRVVGILYPFPVIGWLPFFWLA
jgi:hypothetical protein